MAEETKGSSITLHAHGDGTYHTIAHGSHGGMLAFGDGREPGRKDHKSFGEAMMHIAKLHGPKGDHMHIHGEEDGFTTHHVMEHGRVEGPDEHRNMRGLKKHVEETMDADGDY